jgi:RNA polymerase sigma factor (sigma-70 family)
MESDSTCWTVIRGAAGGHRADRDEFVRRYVTIVREYLSARWYSPARRPLVDDGVQEVFLECFRQGGALGRVDPARAGGFRAFLFGIVRNVALRLETDAHRRRLRADFMPPDELGQVPASEESLSKAFDRAWAKAVVREATDLLNSRAREAGDEAVRRAEILKLRFVDGMPIRDIARLWEADPAVLHHQYARARDEFRRALRDVVAFEHPDAGDGLDRHCDEVLAVLNRS